MSGPGVVDCHHHLWDLGMHRSQLVRRYRRWRRTRHRLRDLAEHRYEWLHADPPLETFLGDYSSIQRNYLIEDYLADARPAGIVKSVHVQCEFDAADPVGETEWLQGLADRGGFPHGIVGFVNLADPGAAGLLDAHAGFANFRGVRQNLNFDAADPRRSFADRGDYLSDPAWRRGFSLLAARGLSFDLQILPSQMGEAYDALAACPETTVVLDHLGLPLDRTAEAMAVWRTGLRRLASLPTVAVKLSGFGMMDRAPSAGTIRPVLLEAIDIFGTDRCMFAGNFPVDSLGGSLADFFDVYRSVVADFGHDEQTALFARNAERFYRI